MSAPHLARSYHYLFPIKHFKEIQFEGTPSSCYACQKTFGELDKKVCRLFYKIQFSSKLKLKSFYLLLKKKIKKLLDKYKKN